MQRASPEAAPARIGDAQEQQQQQQQGSNRQQQGGGRQKQARRSTHRSPVNRVTESEASTASDQSPLSAGLRQHGTSAGGMDIGASLRMPAQPAHEAQLYNGHRMIKQERNTPTPPHFLPMHNSHTDELEQTLLVTPLPSDEARCAFAAAQHANFSRGDFSHSWSGQGWNTFPDMQLGVPTLVGVGVDDMWNELHEFGVDSFAGLDDVLQDVHTPHQMLENVPKFESGAHGLFPAANESLGLSMSTPSPDRAVDRKTNASPAGEQAVPDLKVTTARMAQPARSSAREGEISTPHNGKGKPQSRFRGVTLRSSGKWQAQIYVQGNCRYLGMYETEQEAACAYENARRQLEQQGRRCAKRRTSPSDSSTELQAEALTHGGQGAVAAPARRSGRAPRPNKRYTDEFEIDVDAADDLQSSGAGDDNPTSLSGIFGVTGVLKSRNSPQVHQGSEPFNDSPGALKRARDAAHQLGVPATRPKLEAPGYSQYSMHKAAARPNPRDAFFPDDLDEEIQAGVGTATRDRSQSRMEKLQQLERALQNPTARFLFEVLHLEHRITIYSVAPTEEQHFKSLFLALLVERGPLNAIVSKCHNYLLTHPAAAHTHANLSRLIEHAIADQRMGPQLNGDNREKLKQVDTQLCRLWTAYKSKLARTARSETSGESMRMPEHMRQFQHPAALMTDESMRLALQHQQHQQMLAQHHHHQQHQQQHHQQLAAPPSAPMQAQYPGSSRHGAASSHISPRQYFNDFNEADMAAAVRPEYAQHNFSAVSPQAMKQRDFYPHSMQQPQPQQQQQGASPAEYLYSAAMQGQSRQNVHQHNGSQQPPFLYSNMRA